MRETLFHAPAFPPDLLGGSGLSQCPRHDTPHMHNLLFGSRLRNIQCAHSKASAFTNAEQLLWVFVVKTRGWRPWLLLALWRRSSIRAYFRLHTPSCEVRYGTPGHLALSMASFGPPLLCSGYALLNDKACKDCTREHIPGWYRKSLPRPSCVRTVGLGGLISKVVEQAMSSDCLR